jgi:hypothetical protein
MDDIFTRIVENLGNRVSGPMKFRLFLQPLMAAIFGIVSGLKDARAGKPAYFWALLTHPAERASMVKDGWKSVGKVFVLALVLDVIYQVVVQRFVYPGEALLVALLLAIVPYLILRGPVTRLARRGFPVAGAAGGNPRGGSPPGPAQGK